MKYLKKVFPRSFQRYNAKVLQQSQYKIAKIAELLKYVVLEWYSSCGTCLINTQINIIVINIFLIHITNILLQHSHDSNYFIISIIISSFFV